MKLSTRTVLIISCLTIFSLTAFSQRTWTGGGGDGLWATPANWNGGTVPLTTEQVLLDNSTVAGSYTVTLPTGTVNTKVARLTITPLLGNNITFAIPSGNTNNPAFTVGDSGSTNLYDLIINNGGIVRNSSGASTGAGIAFLFPTGDSLYIADGGRYIHNTTRANSTIVSQNAKVPGTENGTFEFDAPAGATYNLTLSGRVYGILAMSSTAASGARTYGGSGTSTLLIRGALNIGTGVTYISTQTGNLNLAGNMVCSGTGTFSGTAQAVNFIGTSPQTVTSATPVPFAKDTVNNASGVTFNADVTIAGNLHFANGRITLGTNSLTMGALGTITGASATNHVITTSSGTLTRKGVGAADVFFPVAVATGYCPVTINNAGVVDTFSVRVQPTFDTPATDPTKIVNRQWTITESVPGGSVVTLTFQWNSADHAAAFSIGNPVYIGRYTGLQWDPVLATLGGSDPYTATASGYTTFSPFGVGNVGALPIQLASFTAQPTPDQRCVALKWRTISEVNNYGFHVQRSRDGINFVRLTNSLIPGNGTTIEPHDYAYQDCSVTRGVWYYRLEQIDLDGTVNVLPNVRVEIDSPTGVSESAPKTFALQQNYPNPFNPETNIRFSVEVTAKTSVRVFNLIGQQVATLFNDIAEAGRFYDVKFNGTMLTSGVYFYKLESGNQSAIKKLMFVK